MMPLFSTWRFLSLALLSLAGVAWAAPDPRPNLVVIMADDLGYGSLGCYGNKAIRTPHLDQLAASGVRLTDFHSNGTVCSPTRAALLTGRYPQRCLPVPDEELSPVFRAQRQENPAQRWAWGISRKELTVAGMLRQAGYRTALIGKWHLGYDIQFHPMNFGFHVFRGFMGGNVDYHTHIAGYGLKQLDWWNGRETINDTGYATDLLAKYAVEFIAAHKEKPFFLYLAQGAPHDPWQGRDPARRLPPDRTYQEMIEALDDSVGLVMAALREHLLEKNTLVIFCSDNGAAAPRGVPANRPWQGRKGSPKDGGMKEGGHRVPFIASWPGVIPASTICQETVMTMDLLPTLAALGRVVPPEGHTIDGIDILPVLTGKAKVPQRALHWLFGQEWAVREGPWKLSGIGDQPLALVHLEQDPDEKSNRLSAEPALVEKLLQLHRQWMESTGHP